jgi:hypothetical protein
MLGDNELRAAKRLAGLANAGARDAAVSVRTSAARRIRGTLPNLIKELDTVIANVDFLGLRPSACPESANSNSARFINSFSFPRV